MKLRFSIRKTTRTLGAVLGCVGALLAAPVQAEIMQFNGQVFFDGLDFFPGDEGDEEEGGAPRNAAKRAAPDPVGAHVLEFADGNRLHGTLEALDTARQELIWRRADVSVPFTFPLAQITSLSFGERPKSAVKVQATIKLTGSDWLAADVVGMQANKLHLKLHDGSPLTVDRAQVEWIYFTKGPAPECYDGPTSFAGWTSGGSWTYRDGALRAASPTAIARHFEALPDQTEYFFEVDQGGDFVAFTINLHHSNAMQRGNSPGTIQLMFRGTTLQLWAQVGGNMKAEQVDLAKVLRAPGELGSNFKPATKRPMQYRILEDHPGGRLLVYIDGRKAADWSIGKGKAGENRGSFSFQPQTWNANTEQAISKVRIGPWDGRVPAANEAGGEALTTDRLTLAGGDVKDGRIESINDDKIRVQSGGGFVEVAREKVGLVRFKRPASPADEEPPVAQVRLAHRGEFAVVSLSFRKGRIVAQTTFGGELVLGPDALRGLEFLRSPWTGLKTTDTLVFKNGDQLRGLLDGGGTEQKLRWRLARADTPFEVEAGRVAGVLFAPRKPPAAANSNVLARFRNGDALTGEFITLDKEKVVMDTAGAGQLSIPRERVQTIYFPTDGVLPILDGANEPEAWLNSLALLNQGSVRSKKKSEGNTLAPKQPSPWLYLDGGFTYLRPEGVRPQPTGGTNLSLGRIFDAMPERVEVRFDVTSHQASVFLSAQIFTEPENPGYMLQMHSQGMYVYDMAPRQRGRAMVQQQQIQFGDKVKPEARQRRVQLLADRPSGKLTVVVDGVVVGQFGQKPPEGGRNLGCGIAISPQPNMPCTISNLWIAPWDGALPGKARAVTSDHPDTVLLANGDEAQGTIALATPETVKLDSEVGAIDLPVPRLRMIDFGGTTTTASGKARLRFGGSSALTVKSYRIEQDMVVCESEIAGELKLPLAALQELVLTELHPRP